MRNTVQALASNGSVDARGSRIRLDEAAVANWDRRIVALPRDAYDKQVKGAEVNLGAKEDVAARRCADNIKTPVFYANTDGTRTLRTDRNRLTLRDGQCVRLQQGKTEIVLGTYTFEQPFSAQVSQGGRIVALEEALKQRMGTESRQTDSRTTELGALLLGEAVGFIYESAPFLHITLFERRRGNYYRLVLIGDRTLVAMDVYGTTSMSTQDLQAAAVAVVQALRFDR